MSRITETRPTVKVMDSCKHLSLIKKWNHSILDPQKWMCYICGTTESVWACLSCPNVACGRYNEEHALKHFQEKQHPLCIEVNEKYVYCYECDDYVLNDNAAGDLKILRSALSAIATQSFSDIESRGRRLLRSYSHSTVTSPSISDEDDKIVTADFHRRKCLLGKVFTSWRLVVQDQKMARAQETPVKQRPDALASVPSLSPGSSFIKRRTIIPGVTGLRNLGNTCYMNSILQVLSHLQSFREFFIQEVDPPASRTTTPDTSPRGTTSTPPHPHHTFPGTSHMETTPHSFPIQNSSTTVHHPQRSESSTPRSTRFLSRQTTVECFQHLMTPVSSKKGSLQGGLNGGSTLRESIRRKLICSVEEKDTSYSNISLCQELNGLFRVLWSGRWAQVSPHAFLQAVWQHIPTFKGHAQHDAQEFLCELLDKVQSELESRRHGGVDIVAETFQGQLVSQVKCLACNNVSDRREPFMDLSLEFPERYQITEGHTRVAQDVCHVKEMLDTFTEVENLGEIYSCEKCNANRSRRKSTSNIYTFAEKQILIEKLPPVLRLHLKRFRWSGRLHREKISTEVGIDDVLDMQPFCVTSDPRKCMYQLLGVIVHHGRGFGCGHYTAYCWNSEAESWVHCNDSRMKLCGLEEVLLSQCYILVYTRTNESAASSPDSSTEELEHSSTEELEHSLNLSQGSLSKSEGSFSQIVDDDITFNFKTPPPAVQTAKRKLSGDVMSDTDRIIKRRRSTLW